MIATRALSVTSLALLVGLAACSSTSGEGYESLGSTRSAVINGKPSDASQDAVVLLVHYDPTSRTSGIGQCTGTLLAPRLVLTARHCVGDTDRSAACKSDGTPIALGVVRSNHKASSMYVFTGKDRPDFSGRTPITPAGKGIKILDDGGKNLCNRDIALIVLEKPITNVPISPIRLDGDVEVGELITAVGWGVTQKTRQPNQRQQRMGVKILSVGPDSTKANVPPNEFEVGESICSGDSGGPAIAQETNAVVGVVSRGGNRQGQSDTDPAAACIDGTNLYTKIAPFKELIMQGYELAEAEPWIEGGPDPRKLKATKACTSGDECRSALCLPDPAASGETTCAEDCSATETCTDETQVCTTEGDARVCRAPEAEELLAPAPAPTPPTASASTCSAAPGSHSNGGLALVFGLVALVGVRRKKR